MKRNLEPLRDSDGHRLMHRAAHLMLGPVFDASADSMGFSRFVTPDEFATAEAFADTAAMVLAAKQEGLPRLVSLVQLRELKHDTFWDWCPNYNARVSGLSHLASPENYALMVRRVEAHWTTLESSVAHLRLLDAMSTQMPA